MSSRDDERRRPTIGQVEDAAAQLERDVAEIVARELVREEVVDTVARAVVRGLRSTFGGGEVYIPASDNRARDERIRREFYGARSIAAIRGWSGLSRPSIYRIAKAGRLSQSAGRNETDERISFEP